MKIYFVTTSAKKVKELSYYLGIDLIQFNKEIEEIQGTDEEIAIDKLFKACKLNENNLTIIDDCSLEIESYKTLPGPYFKDFINMGLETLDKLVEAIGRRSKAKCMLGIGRYQGGKFDYKIFSSSVPGEISKYNGKQKCFDDLFVPEATRKTYSQLTLEESRLYNHRGVASQPLKKYIQSIQ
ncbi:Inosine triphosphate pyrophosphatase [Nosema granulosis]|uniref:Inosine triphosphate pyrophosphatase n=1 Tax=Nosema granulosis TaxID=83296 RepID=A0A9P6KZ24_9MICR|nr:Inosine triphosphate pyrophosphatase [Nosema granulosis]